MGATSSACCSSSPDDRAVEHFQSVRASEGCSAPATSSRSREEAGVGYSSPSCSPRALEHGGCCAAKGGCGRTFREDAVGLDAEGHLEEEITLHSLRSSPARPKPVSAPPGCRSPNITPSVESTSTTVPPSSRLDFGCLSANEINALHRDGRLVARSHGPALLEDGDSGGEFGNARGGVETEGTVEKRDMWGTLRPALFTLLMGLTLFGSSYVESLLDVRSDDREELGEPAPALESLLRYGTIPVVAAIIGYGTNIVALQMMFYPLEFIGFFPWAKIGCGLDLPLFGWQGVIPMKARQMAEISVDLMTQRLIQVEEVFDRLDPQGVAKEVEDILPDVISKVVNEAGRKHCPKLWEYLPMSVKAKIEERVVKDSGPLMAGVILDLKRNISKCWDLKHCVVERMVKDKQVLNDIFLTVGEKEFQIIRISGFYLGFLFGFLQMLVWIFVKQWWILPLCGVLVGYLTNVVALKMIFLPVEKTKMGCFTVQGLFLQRQAEVSAVYSHMVAEKVLHAEVLMESLLNGPRSEELHRLVDKHVAKSMEDQGSFYKPVFLLSIGAETWADYRAGMCVEFRKSLPLLLARIVNFTQESLRLEATLHERMVQLPSRQFERLLHAVFEQDEIKLILVGAVLGAIVGFVQALVQTPEQLGLA